MLLLRQSKKSNTCLCGFQKRVNQNILLTTHVAGGMTYDDDRRPKTIDHMTNSGDLKSFPNNGKSKQFSINLITLSNK